MGRYSIAILAFVGALWLPAVSSSQTLASGAIAGVVKDTTGAVLPGVTVEATSPALIEKVRTVVTDERGQYKIVDLRPGTYTVTFALTAFSGVRREGLELTTGFTATVNAELRVGALDEAVTVTGASPVVDTQNVRTQNVMTRETLDTLPTGKSISGYTALTLGATNTGGQDVGGSRGEITDSIAIHGSRANDQKMMIDGMLYTLPSLTGGGVMRMYMVNQAGAQEIVLETGGISAESETRGIQMNVVPKEGGNTFRTYLNTNGTGRGLQNDNLSDELRARGLAAAPAVKKIYDVGVGLGGPFTKDRLWFYTAHRWWSAEEYVPGNYFNATQHTLFYTPDLSRPAYRSVWNEDHSIRLTWQASQKHKITISESLQHNCTCYMSIETNRAPEASNNVMFWPISLTQASWTYPITNRLLLQAGSTYGHNVQPNNRVPETARTDIAVTELSTGYLYGARVGLGLSQYGTGWGHQANGRFVATYVTGSHALKAGVVLYRGLKVDEWAEMNDPPVMYSFRKPTADAAPLPVSVTYYAAPLHTQSRSANLGLYVQDQWTLKKMTLNLGVRFDRLHAWNPAQTKPAGPFVPEVRFAKVDNVPNWNDLSPRLGAAYDLFGNGKTAIKGSVGRYVIGAGTGLARENNPQTSISTTASRAWNDLDGDYVPQNDELGPISNNLFGSVVISQRYASELLTGWWVRPYNWETSISLQHELRPGIGLTAGYFRTWYGNFYVTDNLKVAPTDYDPFCVTAPNDTRLPGGGGYQVCGLYDMTRAVFGSVDNLVADATHFGTRSEVYNGVDVGLTARFGGGKMLAGGLSSGRTVIDNCTVVDSPDLRYCKTNNPFAGQTQIKFNGAYPLPWWGLQTSVVLQNLPGIPIMANRPFTNSEVAPSLGRNLSTCAAATGPCTATVSVPLIEPFTMRESRLTQVDIRLTKLIRVGRARLQGMFDVYNLFNESSIRAENATYGSTWTRPTQVLLGRLFKFGAQLEF